MKYKTMHIPAATHEKLSRISDKLKIPMTTVIDRIATATEEAMMEDDPQE